MRYAQEVEPVIEKFGGRFLVRGGTGKVIEGPWQPSLFVLVEFPDVAAIRRFHDSPEYQPLKALRLQGAKTNIAIAVEGIASFASE